MNQFKFSFRTLIHPFDNFWDMKSEKKGKLSVSIFIMLIYYVVTIFNIQVRAFLFNPSFRTPIDLMFQLRILILPIILFVIANWSITTLMEGKGTIKDIIMVVGYSMLPMILFKAITAVLSNFLSLNEDVYLVALDYIGVIWFVILVYIGIQTVHDFEYGKTIVSFVLTFVSMFIILFICFLFFSLIQEIAGFLFSIYKEITFRI